MRGYGHADNNHSESDKCPVPRVKHRIVQRVINWRTNRGCQNDASERLVTRKVRLPK